MQDSVIRLEHITKSFAELRANDDVSLEIQRNEIVALLGENGAGKSTLMKILFGLYTRDSGSICIEGETLPLSYSPNDAMRLGMAMVHQHFKLVEPYTVAQNIVLGTEQGISRFVYSKKKVARQMAQLFARTGMEMPQDTPVRDLPLGDRQRVEILKSLYRGCRILILDEPTTVLTPQETDALFELLRRLRDGGMTIIIITHKLKEVLALSDRVIVMRHGRNIATYNTAETTADELACAMVGRELKPASVQALPCADAQRTLRLCDIHTRPAGGCHLKGLSLGLYAGRIVGVAGVDGNGQTELAEVLAGIRPFCEGSLEAGGKVLHRKSVSELRAAGIRIIPEDRHRQGLVLPLTIRDNLMLGFLNSKKYRRAGLFRMRQVNTFADELIRRYDIRPAKRGAMLQLMSGGNQQKVVLARELTQPELQVVVAAQPSRGLDVGATQFTHSQLLGLRGAGKAVLLISSDLDEIHALSDEIAVIYDGRIVVQRAAGEMNNEQIGLYMGSGEAPEVTH